MKNKLFELILPVIICGFFSVMITISFVTEKSFSAYVRSASLGEAIFLLAIAMTFASIIAICGYVFGVSRGRGKLLSAEDLALNKPFEIFGMESLSHSREILVTIVINGKKKRCSYPRSMPPNGATHIKSVLEGSGSYRFEFMKITPEVVEIVS